MTVTDPTEKKVFERETELSSFGSLDGSFEIPQGAVSGWYQVTLHYNDTEMQPMRFLVSDFTPSPFKVAMDVGAKKLTAGETVKLNAHATLFSGGAYADAPVRQTAVLSYEPFPFDNKDFGSKRFSFSKNMEMWQMSDEVLLNENACFICKSPCFGVSLQSYLINYDCNEKTYPRPRGSVRGVSERQARAGEVDPRAFLA